MTEQTVTSQIGHPWYTRPVLFVADVNRALRFYVDMLGFWKKWHEGDGAGTVCQVNRGECEIILAELADLRRELVERSVPSKETWWGYDSIQIDDPDGNELLFPTEGNSPATVA
jgi:hypothetical protein